MSLPDRPNQCWSLDFVSEQLASGRRFRVLNIVDGFSRECAGQLVDTSISGRRLARFLDEITRQRSLPTSIVCDNGPELTSKAMFFWARERKVTLGLHPAGQADAECINRELQRQVSGQLSLPLPALFPEPDRYAP